MVLARLALGALVAFAGVLAIAYGIGNAVGQANALEDDAVARGVVGGGPVAFESTDTELTVYIHFEGLINEDSFRDSAVAATTCSVSDQVLRGARQGTSATLGDYATIGEFTHGGGAGSIRCSGSRDVEYVVTPHGPGAVFKAVGMIIGGAFALGLGGWMGIAAYLRRRREASA